MTYPNAIVVAATLLSFAIIFSNQSAHSFGGDNGRYALAGDGNGSTIFLLDTQTGETRWCHPSTSETRRCWFVLEKW